MAETFDMIAKTFFGLEGVLIDELTALGATDVRPGRRMAAFRGDQRLMYRANLHLRTAVRVLKPIASFTAADTDALYRGVGLVDWSAHIAPNGSLAIDPVVHSPIFTNSLYVAQLAKDAIVDQVRERTGQRPSVDLDDPDLRINLHIDQDRVTIYLDSSGDSLHKRGYRTAAGEAPLNEVLAAGILRLTQWDEQSPLVDFMCGSGTLVIEGALMARRIAPGLLRNRFGYMRWPDFCRRTHDELVAEARAQRLPHAKSPIVGSDLDSRMIELAQANARRAGVIQDVQLRVENFETCTPPAPDGTLVVNPPYDERMKVAQVEAVYRRIGDALKQRWAGYTAYVFSGNLVAGRQIGLRSSAKTRLFNGPIECRLLRFELFASERAKSTDTPETKPASRSKPVAHESLPDFRNRLSRMAKHWQRWARRQQLDSYRVYDRDIPEIPLSIDRYGEHLLITEHERPHARTEIEQQGWLTRMFELAAETLDVPTERIAVATRGRALESEGHAATRVVDVHEGDLRYEARLSSSGETGIDLHQRILRSMVRNESAGKRVLHLFAGTGTIAVAAVAGGALGTLSIERSQALVDWADRNLRANRLARPEHQVMRGDPLAFVGARTDDSEPFDLIVVEPPGFDGHRRAGVWNVQDGHTELLGRLMNHLTPGGKLYFVTPFKRLSMHAEQLPGATVREITRQTVPADFRNKKVHRCWVLMHASGVET